MKKISCPNCKVEVVPELISRPDTQHDAEMRCPECLRFLGWKRKEKNEGKRAKSKHSPESLRIHFCQNCLTPGEQLGAHESLEIHHIDDNPGNEEEDNILVVCTPCHKLIHHARIYHQHILERKHLEYERIKALLAEESLSPDTYDRLILAITDILGI
jgi:5-methylcytosine-specific restriction endonuclease McrA